MDSIETYVVKFGETLARIAKDLQTDLATLMNLNGLNSTQINPGQVLKVPAKEVTDSAPTIKEVTDPTTSYGLAPGIAVGANYVVQHNLTPVDTTPVDTTPVDTAPVDTAPVDTTPVDTTPVDTAPVDTAPVDTTPAVTLPVPVTVTVPPDTKVPVVPGNTSVKYTVVSGDNMTSIAASHHVTLAELEAANPQVTNDNLIYPGQVLTIPVSSSNLTTVYDSVNWPDIPHDATGIAYYIDGSMHYDSNIDLKQFPDLVNVFTITTTGADKADVIDCENGDVTYLGLADALKASDATWIYINRSTFQHEYNSLIQLRTNGGNVPKFWVADWTNQPHLVPNSDATQWTSTSKFDVSLFNLS